MELSCPSLMRLARRYQTLKMGPELNPTQASEGTLPADTLSLDLYPPDLKKADEGLEFSSSYKKQVA